MCDNTHYKNKCGTTEIDKLRHGESHILLLVHLNEDIRRNASLFLMYNKACGNNKLMSFGFGTQI